ncbi:MAG: hypothetical protein ACRD3R_08895, partial [Terriglobales bacterium]
MAERAKPVALAALTGILLVATFPAPNLTYLAPLALAPLLLALSFEPSPGWRFLLGCVSGWIFWGGVCYWIYWVLNVHGHIPAPGAAALFTGFFLVKGLHLGAFAWLAGRGLDHPWAIPAVAAAWVAIEGTHPYAGFTWLMLGNAAAGMAVLARLAPWTGVAGISFVLAMMNVAVALAVAGRPRKHLAWLLAVPLLYFLPKLPDAAATTHSARLVQPDILEEEIYAGSWDQDRARKVLDQLSALSSAKSPAERPGLIIWPENPAPLYFYNDPLFRSYTQEIAQKQNAYLLFGTVAFRDREARQPLN